MVDLLSLVPDAARTALAQWLAERGEPAYRARQVLPRLWERPVGSWDEATELPAALPRALPQALALRRVGLSGRQGDPRRGTAPGRARRAWAGEGRGAGVWA